MRETVVEMVEEKEMERLSPKQMQLAVAKAVAEVGIKTKAERLDASLSPQSSGESRGAETIDEDLFNTVIFLSG